MEFEFLVDGVPHKIALENRDRTVIFRVGEAGIEAEVRRVSANEILFHLPGRTARVHLVRDGGRTLVAVDGRGFALTEAPAETTQPFGGDERTPEGSLRVKSPMPGKVIKLCVREGDEVRKNQTLVVVEAMKMENEIQSPADGIVKTIHTSVGELVDSEKPLIEIESKK
jgi:biotin carboxyl carrier protein